MGGRFASEDEIREAQRLERYCDPKLYVEVDGETFSVETLRLKPGDRLVFTSRSGRITAAAAESIRERAKELFPDNEVVVMEGLKLTVESAA